MTNTKPNSGSFKKGVSSWNKGKKFSEETKKKMSEGMKGRISSNKGKKLSEETKRKISESRKGKNMGNQHAKGNKPWNYIDGRSKTMTPMRYGDDWDKVRYLVYLRDRFTCQHCAIKGERLDVHHKIPFLISFDNSLNNLLTLCRSCHMKEEAKLIKELKSQKIEV